MIHPCTKLRRKLNLPSYKKSHCWRQHRRVSPASITGFEIQPSAPQFNCFKCTFSYLNIVFVKFQAWSREEWSILGTWKSVRCDSMRYLHTHRKLVVEFRGWVELHRFHGLCSICELQNEKSRWRWFILAPLKEKIRISALKIVIEHWALRETTSHRDAVICFVHAYVALCSQSTDKT